MPLLRNSLYVCVFVAALLTGSIGPILNRFLGLGALISLAINLILNKEIEDWKTKKKNTKIGSKN